MAVEVIVAPDLLPKMFPALRHAHPVACGLMTLGAEYRSMLTRAVMAEQQFSELEELLYQWFVEKNAGAETFLREYAAAIADDKKVAA